ncbi:PDR/VanB family oxidoreductase [Amycolatopsis taiwanensis]|uniref:Oxidoreductase n=1 Tax=Amycolatopsis taiwanensis TaxID=342230 RepID=A0A9W6R401_9PSEU|nr:PDR/VanB family oxidoreductase [Amycolatopsis taiwanensis]GLY69086.1 putative oxidoreductase [Amycolatopsis taiwanensis]
MSTVEHEVIVRQLRWEADGVLSLELGSLAGDPLPPWDPGAHVDLVLPTGIERQYSLCGPVGDRSRYRVGIRRERRSRGGSEYVHAFLRPGQRLVIKGPRNNFRFRHADSYLFIAGGIGITPLLPMVRRAESRGVDWKLLYGGHTEASMPFRHELSKYGERVRCYPSDKVGRIPLPEVLAEFRPGQEVYACGPESLISDLQDATAHWPADTVHFERFKARARASTAEDMPFEVVCAASNKTVSVPAGRSIMTAIEEAGIATPSSCRSGICGSCETAVLDGVPEHRDEILCEADRAAGDRMFICVSRARTPQLVLDL